MMIASDLASNHSPAHRVVIVIIGLALFCALLVPPAYFGKTLLWTEVPCQIISLFDYEVGFEYEIDGQRHQATQDFQLVQGGMPNHYRLGDVVACLVNPNDPDEAILKRQSSLAAVIFFACSLIPPFLVAWWVIRQRLLRSKGKVKAI